MFSIGLLRSSVNNMALHHHQVALRMRQILKINHYNSTTDSPPPPPPPTTTTYSTSSFWKNSSSSSTSTGRHTGTLNSFIFNLLKRFLNNLHFTQTKRICRSIDSLDHVPLGHAFKLEKLEMKVNEDDIKAFLHTFCHSKTYPDHPLVFKSESSSSTRPSSSLLTLTVDHISPMDSSSSNTARSSVMIYLHGGAYCFGSPKLYRFFTTNLSTQLGIPVIVPSYRLAPDHIFPSALIDSFLAYLYLVQPHHPLFGNNPAIGTSSKAVSPDDIILAGDSAGGGLATSLIVFLKDYCKGEFGVPSRAFLISPWMDLSGESESHQRNQLTDILPANSSNIHAQNLFLDNHPHPAAMYMAGRREQGQEEAREDRKELLNQLAKHPLISPIHANKQGMPPMLIQVGGGELLLDDARRFASSYCDAQRESLMKKNQLTLEVYEGMWHDFQLVKWTSISRLAMKNVQRWMNDGDQNQTEKTEE